MRCQLLLENSIDIEKCLAQLPPFGRNSFSTFENSIDIEKCLAQTNGGQFIIQEIPAGTLKIPLILKSV